MTAPSGYWCDGVTKISRGGVPALSGGTISVVIVQESALGVGLTAVAIFPVLIAALQGLIGFPLTSIILRKEAARLKGEYRAGRLEAPVKDQDEATAASTSRLPAFLQNTPGTLFIVGLVVLASLGINNLTNGTLNTFVMALIFGIDRFMSQGRALTNLIGNGIATIVIAKWENDFEPGKFQAIQSAEAESACETAKVS